MMGNWKKIPAILLALALWLCGAAFAEEGVAGAEVCCDIEDGSYVIRIADENGDLGWLADDMAQDDSVVKLAGAELEDGAFVVRYDPVGDGEATVSVKHYLGIACDQVHTWDLRVRDGAVQESTGGSYTASPEEGELDPWLVGEWLEQETQFTQMTIARNVSRGWDVEIASPLTHGAYIFMTTVVYDCDRDGFVYDKGKFWEVPITDSDEAVELGEAAVAGTTGIFTFSGDDENLLLRWVDDTNPEREVVLCPAGAGEASGSEVFLGEWNDDRVSAEIKERMGGFMVTINGANGASESTSWLYTCSYDPGTGSLISDGDVALKVDYTADESDEMREEIVYEDGEAVFTLDEAGRLVWEDKKENAGEGRAFERVSDPVEDAVVVDYGASDIFTREDMDAAIEQIEAEFDTWEGCELHAIRYAGDDCVNGENLAYVNSLEKDRDYVDCILFFTDFHSPVEGGGAWEADAEYPDFQWWLAREEGSDWELLTWGY